MSYMPEIYDIPRRCPNCGEYNCDCFANHSFHVTPRIVRMSDVNDNTKITYAAGGIGIGAFIGAIITYIFMNGNGKTAITDMVRDADGRIIEIVER